MPLPFYVQSEVVCFACRNNYLAFSVCNENPPLFATISALRLDGKNANAFPPFFLGINPPPLHGYVSRAPFESSWLCISMSAPCSLWLYFHPKQ